MIKKLFLTYLTMIGIGAFAQTDGILWKVTGKGLSKPTYILGTIHITCNSNKIMTPLIDSLIAKTDVLATEINFTDANEIQKIMQSGSELAVVNINEILSDKEFKLVDSVCNALLNDALLKYNSTSLMTVMSAFIMSPKIIGCTNTNTNVIDLLITNKAFDMAKKMIGLDGFEFQKALLDSIPLAEQKQWLMDFCKDIEKSKKEFMALENAYYSQKAEELYTISFKTNPEFAKYEDVFLTQRNIKWVNYLVQNMKLNSYFVAVGAAHLGGVNGIVALLKKQGYKVVPMLIK